MAKKKKCKVLFAAFEAAPFSKTGGLGDVAGALPPALGRSGCDVRVIVPKLSVIPKKYRDQMEPVATFTVSLSWRQLYCGIEKLEFNGVTYYFVDNEFYFYRDKVYGCGDDAERVAYFSMAILESMKYVEDLDCDVLHCNDWHTAMVPVFLHELYWGDPRYEKVKTIFSIHNLKFQGIFDRGIIGDVLGLHEKPAAVSQLAYGGAVNMMKGALLYSDILSTVSPTYAEEIKTDYFGENLDYIFNRRCESLYGILNGIEVEEYDPAGDEMLPYRFTKDDLSGKAKNKAALQEKIGLEINPDKPLVVMISRLTEQKGLDLLLRILDELLGQEVQVAVLGTGDSFYEAALRSFEEWHKGKMCSYLAFDPALSHLFYAGADMLVMPSRFEPCGLSQMIAMRYGTLPVVRETGGLKDSVIPYNKYTGEGTGFSFANFNAHELLFVLKDAIALYHNDKQAWQSLMHQAMTTDVSWDRHALEYMELYHKLIG